MSLFRNPRSQFWYYAFRRADGRRTTVSTNETDRDKARIAGENIVAEDQRKWLKKLISADIRRRNPNSVKCERAKVLQKKYGLSPEKFDELLAAQNNRCAVCCKAFNSKRIPHVDHCHRTSMVRGILCINCNTAEGMLGSLKTAKNLVKYMEKTELFYKS